jgi:hypothetical protein
MRRAASRAACTAGSNSPTMTPMIAITTSSSTNVNPDRRAFVFRFLIIRIPIGLFYGLV